MTTATEQNAISEAQAVIDAAAEREAQQSIQVVRDAVQEAKNQVQRTNQAVRAIYAAVIDADEATTKRDAGGYRDRPFGEALWGEAEPDYGVHVVLASYYSNELVEADGIVAIRGWSLATYLRQIDERLAKLDA